MKTKTLYKPKPIEETPKGPTKFIKYLSNTLKLTIAGTLLFVSITKAERAPYLSLNTIKPEDIARAEHVEVQEENKKPYELDIKTIYELKEADKDTIAVCGYVKKIEITNVKNILYNFSLFLEDGPIGIICEKAIEKNKENKKLLKEIENAIKNAKKTQDQVKIIVYGFCNGETFTLSSIIILGSVNGSLWNAEKFDF